MDLHGHFEKEICFFEVPDTETSKKVGQFFLGGENS
jgi:hypothetical protein